MTDTLTIVASMPEDGWAFVRHGDAYYHVRQPYGAPTPTTEASAFVAVCHYYWHACNVECADWSAVYEYLCAVMRAEREKRDPGPDYIDNLGEHVLRALPRIMLVRFLERVENVLLPSGKHDSAKKILSVILDETRRRGDLDTNARAMKLQMQIDEAT